VSSRLGLGESPFSDPVASGVARNTWRQIIHNLTSNPLEGEEQLRITDEMIYLKPPSFPPSPKSVGLGVGLDEWFAIKKKTASIAKREKNTGIRCLSID
jgi:hypothetical protein